MSQEHKTLRDMQQRHWEELAGWANEHAQEGQPELTWQKMRDLYLSGVQEFEDNPVTDPAIDGLGTSYGPWSFNVVDSIGVTVQVDADFNDINNWKVELTGWLTWRDRRVWKTTYTFSPTETGVQFKPHVWVAKGELDIDITGEKHCLIASGKLCYLSWRGWHCSEFNKKLHCFT